MYVNGVEAVEGAMRSFHELTTAGQVRRLRKLALAAGGAFGVEPARITLLKHSLNTTFRLDVEPSTGWGPSRRPECYVVRIHRPDYHDTAAIRSELRWLRAIRRETELIVPEPVCRPDGGYTVTAETAGVPEARICTVFQWIDGLTPRQPLSVRLLRRVGAFLARLHLHGRRFGATRALVRKHWDVTGLRGAAVGVDPSAVTKLLAPTHRELHRRAVERLQAGMDMLGDGPEVFGLIHSDPFRENLLVHRDDVRVIDFDGSGWGYYVYDLGVVLTECRHLADYSRMASALLHGYRQFRPLSRQEELLLDTFIGGRIMVHSAWVAGHAHEPAVREQATMLLDQKMRDLAALLDSRPQPVEPPSEGRTLR